MKKTLLLMFLALMLPLTVAAQSHYAVSSEYYLGDNTVNCRTQNCYLPVSTTPAPLTQISTGYDLSVYGIDAAGNIYNLPQAGSSQPTWTKMTSMAAPGGYPVKWIAVRSATEIYASVANPTTACGSTVASLYRWNGSSWTILPGDCLDEISVTGDDTLVGINRSWNGQIFYTIQPSAAAPHFIGLSTGWVHVTGLNAGQAFGMAGNTLYQIDLYHNTSSAFPNTGPIEQLAVTNDQKLYVISTTSGANGNTWMFDMLAANETWHNLPGGNMNGLFGSLPWAMFSLNGTTTPYHLLNLAVSASVNVNGYYDCNQFPNGCPSGAIHTATAKIGFPRGYFKGNQSSSSGQPSDTLNVTASDTSGDCDTLFGDPSSSECILQAPTSVGSVDCSIMGTIVSQPIQTVSWSKQTETAYTKFANVGLRGTGDCVMSGPGEVCTLNVTPICSNTTNPDYKYPGGPPPAAWIRDYDFAAWRSVAECFRVVWTGGKTPWICQGIWPLNVGTSDVTPGNCTYTP